MSQSNATSVVVDAPAEAVFDAITDIPRLPEWNPVIRSVKAAPERLDRGAQWVVELHAMGSSWDSRSTVTEHSPEALRFAYRSQTDDGNPSFADWTWSVAPVSDDQCRVDVTWSVNPKTFWRRVLLSRIRGRQLRNEVPASVNRLAAVAARSAV